MNKPHPHAELIKQWADGAEIEFQRMDGTWEFCDVIPKWSEYTKYRIQPEPVQNVVSYAVVSEYGHTSPAFTKLEVLRFNTTSNYISIGRKILRTEINPNTLELVSAKIVPIDFEEPA